MPKVMLIANDTTYTYNLRRELILKMVEKYKDVVVVCKALSLKDELVELGCRFINVDNGRHGTNPLSDLVLLINYMRILKKERPNVVLTFNIKPDIYAGISCKWFRIPYITKVTGLGMALERPGLFKKIHMPLYKYALSSAKCIFFQNIGNKNFFYDNGIIRDNFKILPGSGVNLEKHKFETYPVECETIRFLFIGRIMKDKGVEELLYAFKSLINKGLKISLDIVGGLDENYESFIKNAEKVDGVKYYGQQNDIHSYIKNSHCVLLPSYHEGMSNVLLESASTGRPVIASNIHGCIETFDEGISGFGCEVKSGKALASAMEKFIELKYVEKKKMGLNGRKKVEKEFDRNIVVNEYIHQIDMVIK